MCTVSQEGLDRRLFDETGGEDDFDLWFDFSQPIEDFFTVHLRHPHVKDHEAHLVGGCREFRNRFLSAAAQGNTVSVSRQRSAEQLANVLLIVHDENTLSSGALPVGLMGLCTVAIACRCISNHRASHFRILKAKVCVISPSTDLGLPTVYIPEPQTKMG